MTEKEIRSLEKAKNICEILDGKKATGLKLLYVRNQTVIADYFVLANGTSTTQVNSLADEVEFQMKDKYSIDVTSKQGHGGGQWVVLDYDDVIVHVFHPESRDYYNLDKLWADASEIDFATADAAYIESLSNKEEN